MMLIVCMKIAETINHHVMDVHGSKYNNISLFAAVFHGIALNMYIEL